MSEENIKLLKKAGLKITEPRLTILALMQEHKNEHFSAEDVYKILLEQGSDIGLAQAATDEERNKFIEGGDKVFEQYMNELPNNYVGPFYRAQLWITDNTKAEEKPREYYSKALELIGNNEDYVDQKKVALTSSVSCKKMLRR